MEFRPRSIALLTATLLLAACAPSMQVAGDRGVGDPVQLSRTTLQVTNNSFCAVMVQVLAGSQAIANLRVSTSHTAEVTFASHAYPGQVLTVDAVPLVCANSSRYTIAQLSYPGDDYILSTNVENMPTSSAVRLKERRTSARATGYTVAGRSPA